MPLLGFQKRFASKILSGEKVTTIRAMRKDGRDPKRGDTLYLDIHVRTKKQRRLMVAPCTSARRIKITRGKHTGLLYIFLDDKWIFMTHRDPVRALRRIVRGEGFETIAELIDTIERFHGFPFRGFLIRWKPPQ